MNDDCEPGTFEEALMVAFGERASEFSEQLRASLHTLYRRGRRDGKRAERAPTTYRVHKMRHWESMDEEGYTIDPAWMMARETER